MVGRYKELRRRLGQAEDIHVHLLESTESSSQEVGSQSFSTDSREPSESVRSWSGRAEALLKGDSALDKERPYSVLGGAGTGKSFFIVDAAVEFLNRGGKADHLLVITPSKESAADLRDKIFRALRKNKGYASDYIPVRSIHSWAFALVRSFMQEDKNQGDSQPLRLVSGAEHDIQIRQMLRAHYEDGGYFWQSSLVPALPTRGFARQLRDFLLRTEERGLTATDLQELGERYQRKTWENAGQFQEEYKRIQNLSQKHNSINASELLHRVNTYCERLFSSEEDSDRQSFSGIREWMNNIELILVDDAHNLNPEAGEFIEHLWHPGIRLILTGDVDQSIFHFRGASEKFLEKYSKNPHIILSRSHRLSSDQAEAVNALSRKLPASPIRIPLRAENEQLNDDRPSAGAEAIGGETGSIDILEEDSQPLLDAAMIRRLREEHYERSVPWSDMAIVVRTTSDIPHLMYMLSTVGIPTTEALDTMVLSDQPMVAALIRAAQYLVYGAYEESTGKGVYLSSLLGSPLGGADPYMLHRVELGVQESQADHSPLSNLIDIDHAIHLLITGQNTEEQWKAWTAHITESEKEIFHRIRAILDAGAQAYRSKRSPEEIFWELWSASEKAHLLQRQALIGGVQGAQADRDLDAVMNFFDFVGDYTERNPQSSVAVLIQELQSQEIPTPPRERSGVIQDAVSILPVHATVGRQWNTVLISGAYEGKWPTEPSIGGIFRQSELVDYIDRGIEPGTPLSRFAEHIQEERRLFLVALSRAYSKTVILSMRNEEIQPSRFVEEIRSAVSKRKKAHHSGDGEHSPFPQDQDEMRIQQRVLRPISKDSLIAELRVALHSDNSTLEEKHAAAHNLRLLSDAGIYGSEPQQWWGTRPLSSQDLIVQKRVFSSQSGHKQDGEMQKQQLQVVLSPSKIERMKECQLASFYEGLLYSSEAPARMGTFIHVLAEVYSQGMTRSSVEYLLEKFIPLLDPEHQRQWDRWKKDIHHLMDWLDKRSTDNTVKAEENFRTKVTEFSLPSSPQSTATEKESTSSKDNSAHSERKNIELWLSGKIDRQEISSDGTISIIDYKTSKTVLSKAKTEKSEQLKAYQFLVSQAMKEEQKIGQAMLVFSNGSKKEKRKADERIQPAISIEEREHLIELYTELALEAVGPRLHACRRGDCRVCSVLIPQGNRSQDSEV